jgi:hypothetical protein
VTDAEYSATGLRGCSFPPGDGRAQRVRDVLLVTMNDNDGDADVRGEYTTNRPAGLPYFVDLERVDPGPVDLGRGVMLGALAPGEKELIINACSPRGHYAYPHHHDRLRYAFWRDVTDEALNEHGYAEWGWDEERFIQTAVALSRWIRDNAARTRFVGRVVDYDNGDQQVIPQERSESSHAYRLPLVERDWLDVDDAGRLRELLDAYWARQADLPERLARAIWRAELAS